MSSNRPPRSDGSPLPFALAHTHASYPVSATSSPASSTSGLSSSLFFSPQEQQRPQQLRKRKASEASQDESSSAPSSSFFSGAALFSSLRDSGGTRGGGAVSVSSEMGGTMRHLTLNSPASLHSSQIATQRMRPLTVAGAASNTFQLPHPHALLTTPISALPPTRSTSGGGGESGSSGGSIDSISSGISTGRNSCGIAGGLSSDSSPTASGRAPPFHPNSGDGEEAGNLSEGRGAVRGGGGCGFFTLGEEGGGLTSRMQELGGGGAGRARACFSVIGGGSDGVENPSLPLFWPLLARPVPLAPQPQHPFKQPGQQLGGASGLPIAGGGEGGVLLRTLSEPWRQPGAAAAAPTSTAQNSREE